MKIAAAGLLVMLAFSGCQKIMDYYDPGEMQGHAVCRIAGYSYDFHGSSISTSFSYDAKGNPIQVTYIDSWLPDGQATEIFQYDDQNRLIFHIPEDFKGGKRQYVYEGNSPLPARDTSVDVWGNKYVESFRYDDAGRIISLNIEWVFAPEEFQEEFKLYKPEVFRYYYDVHGNRQANPYDHPWHRTIRYSDKPSLYSLHPTWQLIYRDFSKNNASKIKSFNEHGFPTSFVQSDLDYWQPFFDLSQNAVITYDCSGH